MSKVKDAKQAGGPDPASVLTGLTVAWNMYGFATGSLREGLEGRSDPWASSGPTAGPCQGRPLPAPTQRVSR